MLLDGVRARACLCRVQYAGIFMPQVERYRQIAGAEGASMYLQ
jgi:hypothetical protein